MNAIDAHNLIVTKGKLEILRSVTIAVRAGTITGLIGPSGSGKTTLLRAIVGVQIYKGELAVLGMPAGSKLLRPKIGYVTQNPAVYSDLTVRQNLVYFARVVGAEMNKVDKVISQVSLSDHASQLVASLSGGQRARVSLAIALLGDPELLVLDEPTVGLDPILRSELWQQFSDLASAGKSLVVSSHVMDEAERCEDLILIRDGEVLWNDTREKLFSSTNTTSAGDAFVKAIKVST